MKRIVFSLLAAGSLLLSGCSTTGSGPEQTVVSMIDKLYFGQGTYLEYQQLFARPENISNQDDFDKIRKQGPSKLFPDQDLNAVENHIRAFKKDDKTAVVYLIDFATEKEKDLHWNMTKTDKGWKIQN